MTAQNRYSGYPCSIIYSDGGTRTAFHLRQLQQFSVNTGVSPAELVPMGDLDRSSIMVSSAQPEISFSTRDLESALTNISTTVGECAIDPDDANANSLFFRWQERSDCGTFDALATATHIGWYGRAGLICPQTLSASQADEAGASISFKVWVTSSDGHTAPLTHVDAVDLSAGDTTTPAFLSRYFLGPVTVGGAAVPGISEVSIEFGHEVSSPTFDGDVYPRTSTIQRRMPKITFTSSAGEVGAALNMFGRSSGAVVCHFIKGANYSTRLSLATAGHCSISAAAGMWTTDSSSVSENGDGTVSFSITPTGVLTQSLTATVPTV